MTDEELRRQALWDTHEVALRRIARRAAGRLHSMSNRVVDQDDATQQAIAWLYSHPKDIESRLDDEGEIYASDLYYAAMRHLVPWARREVAQVQRTDLRQQAFYDARKIEALLVHAWAPEGVTTINESGVRAPKDPATGGLMKAMIADVKRALRSAVIPKDRAILFARYCVGETWAGAGRPHGLGDSAARMRAERAVEDMRDFLNGFRPVPDDGPGTREIMSNATARAITERGGEHRGGGADGALS